VQVLLDLAYARVLGTGSQVKKAAVEKHTGIITIEFMPERPVQRTEIERWRRGIAEGLSFSPGPPFVLRIIPVKAAGPVSRPAAALKNALEKI
jgi:hypothetical protein